MSLPTEDNGIERELRRSTAGFPGVGTDPAGLAAVVRRGRRSRVVGRATQLGVAASLVATAAVAAPALFDRGPAVPTVLTHDDEVAPADTAPSIEVLEPADGAVVSPGRVTFRGITDPGAEVRVGTSHAVVDPAGRWSVVLELDAGIHDLTFWSSDAAGRRGFDRVTVTVRPDRGDAEPELVADESPVDADEPTPEPTTETVAAKPVAAPVASQPKAEPKAEPKTEPKPATVAFTANNTYGECSEAVPYDEFHGTAEPGSRVWIWSEYGEAEVSADGTGKWFVRVEFPKAPQGVEFPVKAKSLLTGEKKFFTFTNTGDGGVHQDVAFTADMEDNFVEYDPPYGHWSGTANPGTKIWVGSEYGQAQTVAGDDGKWRAKVWFEQAPYGTSTWAVVVESSNGDRAVFEFTGTRPEPAPEPTKTEPTQTEPPAQEVAFTSDQVYDTTDDDPPHSLYAGTATPGHKIVVFNEWGEGIVFAGDDGTWSLWVEFPGAPRGTTIPVKVKDWDTGEVHTHELQVV